MKAYPDLCDVLDIEEFIHDYKGNLNIYNLKTKLPVKIPDDEYTIILGYLIDTNKIIIDDDGGICWVWNPELVKKYLSRPDLWWSGE